MVCTTQTSSNLKLDHPLLLYCGRNHRLVFGQLIHEIQSTVQISHLLQGWYEWCKCINTFRWKNIVFSSHCYFNYIIVASPSWKMGIKPTQAIFFFWIQNGDAGKTQGMSFLTPMIWPVLFLLLFLNFGASFLGRGVKVRWDAWCFTKQSSSKKLLVDQTPVNQVVFQINYGNLLYKRRPYWIICKENNELLTFKNKCFSITES